MLSVRPQNVAKFIKSFLALIRKGPPGCWQQKSLKKINLAFVYKISPQPSWLLSLLLLLFKHTTTSQKMDQKEATAHQGPVFSTTGDVPAHAQPILSEDLAQCDPKLPGKLKVLQHLL